MSIPVRSLYAGFDPTASSLHLGNLLVILALAHSQRMGHKAVALVGGGTGMIGDPSGRSSERTLLSEDDVKANVKGIEAVLSRMLARATADVTAISDPDYGNVATNSTPASSAKKVTVVNNADWYNAMSVIAFLRDVGKYFRLGSMLAKDSVKRRMEAPAADSAAPAAADVSAGAAAAEADGMSFTEFSYQALQGYDFAHLKKTLDCTVQLGGSDQWGNITAGVDYYSRVKNAHSSISNNAAGAAAAVPSADGKNAKKGDSKKKGLAPTAATAAAAAGNEEHDGLHGLTLPLLTTSSGAKFGKSAGNALWLDPTLTTPYALYQYLLQTTDADCPRLLRLLTLLSEPAVAAVTAAHAIEPEQRLAQRVLGMHVVHLVHGLPGVKNAVVATETLFPRPPVSAHTIAAGIVVPELVQWPPLPGSAAPFIVSNNNSASAS